MDSDNLTWDKMQGAISLAWGWNQGPECAGCGELIEDIEIGEMVHDINESSQYHWLCWRETGQVAWKTVYDFADLRSDEEKSRQADQFLPNSSTR